MQVMTTEDLHKVAPSIFATAPWERVSEKYSFIPTVQVVDALRGEGFQPVKAMQSRSRIEGKRDFTKHLIRFRRTQDLEVGKGGEVPEIVLVNSHDRTSSYQLSAGIFRVVCSNGMIVKSANFGDIKIQHSGNIVERVIEGGYRIVEDLPRVIGSMETMKSIQLGNHERHAFAKAALSLRYPLDEFGNSTSPIQPEQLLEARRHEDQDGSLWTTFNTVQENFMRGGLRGYTANHKRTSTRAIKSVTEDVRINKALWLLAEELGKAIS